MTATTGDVALLLVGLMIFGAFSLIVARYRIIPDIHRRDLKPSLH